MDPFSITAGVVGIVAPTLHVKELQNIADAPGAVKSLTNDLQSVGLALASSKAVMTSCKTSCERFRTSLDRWTRDSIDGTLTWRDRATLGQLQNCNITLTSVTSIATSD
ncbi:hypothetical protein B0H63DRAFT_497666 [Podospora didyma]|uniref:Fungal N-terminal domain-containing protein n=1 Tax=Podospora didyma TaxID=330526 RepID=A0AAE0K2C9_9PEZI|nr:hypothetical protein B0H63DRAFT_497666 [Podospora didyma]